MKNVQKIIAYSYLVAAVFLIYEGFQKWNEVPTRAYLLWGLSAMAIFMFFFKRYQLKKMQ